MKMQLSCTITINAPDKALVPPSSPGPGKFPQIDQEVVDSVKARAESALKAVTRLGEFGVDSIVLVGAVAHVDDELAGG